jgi:lysophospholipase L1-like esterase
VATIANESPKHTHGIIFFYPSKAEYLNAQKGGDWIDNREDFEKISQQYGIKLIDISKEPDWNESLYRPDGTHLTVEGNSVLAHILSGAITNALTP